MEDARPTTGGSSGTLAPQEVYVPGDDGKAKREFMFRGGASVAKDEMTREEKLRRRRREKEKMRKRATEFRPGTQSEKGVNERRLMLNLRKGRVKFIGKEGDIKDVHGQRLKVPYGSNAHGILKL
jgi:U3 small nucleolar RNA-associated protein MPP10